MPARRALTHAAVAVVLLGGLAACSSSVPGSATAVAQSIQSGAAAVPVPDAGSPVDPGGAAEPTDVTSTSERAPLTTEIGRTGWYAGFAVTVDEVTASEGFGGGVDLELTVSYQNITDATAYVPQPSIEVGGNVQDAFVDYTAEVPAGAKTEATVNVSVAPDKPGATLTFEDAVAAVVFVYGDAADNQTRIPLADGAEVDSIEPKDLTVAGSLSQSQVNVEVVSGTLVPSYESGEKGKTVLNLRITLTCAADCQAQGYYVDRSYFTLAGADGAPLAADSRSEFCCEAVYPETVSDGERNILSFVVDSPGTGAYTFKFEDTALTSEGSAPGTFAFTA